MPSRACGGSPSASTWPAARASSPAMTLRPTACWISRSVGIGDLPGAVEQRRGARGFADKDRERRQVGVPFDQSGNRAKSRQRLGVKLPDFGDDARAMVVDAQRAAALELPDAVAGEVDLADRGRRQGGEVDRRVPAVVAGADIDVVDVAQDAATGAASHRRKKLPFRDRRVPPAQIGRRVLDEDAAPKNGLRPIDIAADDAERFFRHRQWQKVGEIASFRDAPREMLRDERRRDALDGAADPVEMAEIEPLGAAQRQADAVQRNRVIAADRLEISERRPAAQIVFGMDLQPRHTRLLVEDGLVVWETQPDPRLPRDRAALRADRGGPGRQLPPRDQAGLRLPPAILPQSPAGNITKDFRSRAWVA